MDIERVLRELRPGAQWALSGNDYTKLRWLDSSPKPRLATIEAKWAEIENNVKWERIILKRNQILKDTLWIVSENTPYSAPDVVKWKKYRLDISTITDDYATPEEVVWPTEPS